MLASESLGNARAMVFGGRLHPWRLAPNQKSLNGYAAGEVDLLRSK
jgi:hypothetical protein